jgi:transposase
MMGRLNHDQEQFFYSFRLEDAVPEDHPVRDVAAVLDLSWVHSELAPFYPRLGRPSIDPVLTFRMLIVGYVFAIRSERALCRDVSVMNSRRSRCQPASQIVIVARRPPAANHPQKWQLL